MKIRYEFSMYVDIDVKKGEIPDTERRRKSIG